MILVDYSNAAIAAITAMVYGQGFQLDDLLVKHSIINSLRNRNMQFKGEYGKLVIVCDSDTSKYWRYDVFPHYKGTRKDKRKADKTDWELIFRVMDETKKELTENFPFPVITVDRCEADDIIGWYAMNTREKCIIIGSDKDYKQCHSQLVCQYISKDKSIARTTTPRADLFELIIRGDTGDGIPNIRSDEDTFIDPDKRQRPMATKKVDQWINDGKIPDLEIVKDKKVKGEVIPGYEIPLLENFERNQLLIDFNFIPDDLKAEIMMVMTDPKGNGNRNSVFKYLAQNKMKVLLGKFTDFF